jgi:hypothetical protein
MNFDANAFLNATTTQVLDTKRPLLVPADYRAIITKLEGKSDLIKNGERAGETWAGLKITYELTLDPSQAAANQGRTKAQLSELVMLDLTEDGMVDYSAGKNVVLGQRYEACGLNEPGMEKSPNMLMGRAVFVNVGHRADRNDATKIYEEIKGVRRT